MQRTRIAGPGAISIFSYQGFLWAIGFLLFSGVIISVVVVLRTQPPTVRNNLVLPKTFSSTPTVAPTNGTTTTTAPETTTTTAATTTMAPTTTPVPDVVITCPANLSFVLGTSFTGGYATAAGGCTVPVIQFSEVKIPSASAINLIVQGTPFSQSNTGAAAPSQIAAVGDLHIVTGINTLNGAFITVTDKNTVPIGSFMLNTRATPGSNCSGSNDGEPQVLWDNEQKVWILLEIGASGTNSLCVYISTTSDPLSTYHAFVYDFGSHYPAYPKIGLWSNVYGLTFNKAPAYASEVPKSMCVLDRAAMISFVPVLNATNPPILCGAPLNGLLSGFTSSGGMNAWTPITAEGGPMPPQATEASGDSSIGAVFFRHVDDELHSGAATLFADTIEVEHWYNINFTASTYNAIRYKVTVNDFDSKNGTVPTPTAFRLNPRREVLMQKASYRYIPEANTQSTVFTLTSHTNITRVYWFELRWRSPSAFIQPRWLIHQQGVLPFNDTVHKFMGSIAMDGNGTIALVYAASSPIYYPSLFVTSRLASDPLNAMRSPLLLYAGDVGSLIGSSQWGNYFSMSADPTQRRTFYLTGQVASNIYPWVSWLVKVGVLGETVQRTWTANDYCTGSANCVQTITAF